MHPIVSGFSCSTRVYEIHQSSFFLLQFCVALYEYMALFIYVFIYLFIYALVGGYRVVPSFLSLMNIAAMEIFVCVLGEHII